MTLQDFLHKLEQAQDTISFEETMNAIDAHYDFVPVSFRNGNLHNQAGENNGSCKVFAFGILNKLSEQQVLACFGKYYREDVLNNPNADDHQNIRNFINTGWARIIFDADPLVEK